MAGPISSQRLARLWLLAFLVVALAAGLSRPAALSDDGDSDGLPDAWETGAGRAYGCDPRHADLLLYTVERTTLTAKVNDTLAHATEFFNVLDVPNPDGQRGIHLHVIRGPKTTRQDDYPTLMKAYLPAALVGKAHFVVFSDAPGGQTNGNASIVGVEEDGWNTLVHELGHQLGLEHEARGFKVQSPLHASLMNYAYLDEFNGSQDAVQFSRGEFAKLRMKETDLDETLPFPIASLQFLTKDPYRFPLKAVGSSTQVDWNRNGIFGESHVRADINYQPSTYLGDRIQIEVAATAPAAAYLGSDLYVAYGVSVGRTVSVVLRKFAGGTQWGPRIPTGLTNVVGDPTLVAYNGRLWLAAETGAGMSAVALQPSGDQAHPDAARAATFPSRPPRQPTLAVLDGHLFLFARDASSTHVLAAAYAGSGRSWEVMVDTGIRSRTAVGVAWNPIRHEAAIVGTVDANAKFRLVAYFRGLAGDQLDETGTQSWIGGLSGGNASAGRPAVLIETSRDAGPQGRLYAYYQASVPGLPGFFSMQVADVTFNGGWLERSAYDQWSITETAPAAVANPNGDITYCYRDKSNNVLNCAFAGSGIDTGEMGDFDEVTFIRTQGLKQSLGK
jgi:hypothetical protein